MIFQGDIIEFNLLTALLPSIIGTVISIIVAIVIAKDAQKRGMEPTIYVLLTCCCSWCVGGLVYLIAASNRPIQANEFEQPSFSSNQSSQYGQQQTTYGQPQYQQPTQPTQPTQPDTQTTMPDVDMIFCPICGSQNKKNAKYCSHCGADIN